MVQVSIPRPVALVVEDHDDTRKIYSAWLEQSGFQVVEATSAEEAFRKAQHCRPAIITTDIGLDEGADGVALCARLKEDPTTRDIPVVAVTAWAMGGHVERAFRSGCDAVLLKPCGPDTLLAEIRRILKPPVH